MPFDPASFFDTMRHGLMGPSLEANEVSGCETIFAAMKGLPRSWCAYALATAWHETAATMQPVREAFHLSEAWRKKNLRYWPWYGRGYVQITWKENYERADKELGLGGLLIADRERAMNPAIAAEIMRRGMVDGWFSRDKKGAHSLARHLPREREAGLEAFVEARRIINGTDKALMIARYAWIFQGALAMAGWPISG